MATWYLIRTTRYSSATGSGPVLLQAGTLVDDTKISLAPLKAAGGIVAPSSDALVKTAAALALQRQLGGASNEELDSIMLGAFANSAYGGGGAATLNSSAAAGATVAAAAAVVPGISFTPASSGTVRIRFWASVAALGAGTFTPIVTAAGVTVAAPAQLTGAASQTPYNVAGEVVLTGQVVGTAIAIAFVSTAGDATVTLGAGATGKAAGMSVSEDA